MKLYFEITILTSRVWRESPHSLNKKGSSKIATKRDKLDFCKCRYSYNLSFLSRQLHSFFCLFNSFVLIRLGRETIKIENLFQYFSSFARLPNKILNFAQIWFISKSKRGVVSLSFSATRTPEKNRNWKNTIFWMIK